jgi:polyhydroxybutyrate depolymerase
MTLRCYAAFASLFIGLVVIGAVARADDAQKSIVVDGMKRTYLLHVPASISGHVALIIAFHGHGGDGASQERLSNMDALADKDGFVVAYPDGVDRGWNDGRPETASKVNDLDFEAALQSDLEKAYPIDPKRVYATGFSNGAVFSNDLACTASQRIAAVAAVSGTLPTVDAPKCRPKRPIPIMLIAGTSDPVMPYAGGEIVVAGERRGQVLSFDDTVAFWAKADGCAPRPATNALQPLATPDGTSVTQRTYNGCTGGSSVIAYTITGGGHTWPGGPQYLPAILIGRASQQLDATQTIVEFFLEHSLP